MRRPRGGFTLVELLVVMLIIAVLSQIAVTQVGKMMLKARAAAVIGEFETVKVAALNYMAENHAWPPDATAGIIPSGLEEFLPDGFSFQREGYRLDWENWILPGGLPKHPDTEVLLGVSISTSDQALADAVVNLLGPGAAHYTLSNNYTFVIEGI